MSNTEAPHEPDSRTAVGGPVQRQVRPHTAGPWHAHALMTASENHKGYRITTGSPKWWHICTANPIDEDGREGFANANLIVAAPDLLAALRECLECEFPVTDKAVIARAEAAIVKAQSGAAQRSALNSCRVLPDGPLRCDGCGKTIAEHDRLLRCVTPNV